MRGTQPAVQLTVAVGRVQDVFDSPHEFQQAVAFHQAASEQAVLRPKPEQELKESRHEKR